MKRTITFKYMCCFCCVLFLMSAIPSVGAADTDDFGGNGFYIISAVRNARFTAYIPHSLSRQNMPDKCLWIQNAETAVGMDPAGELTEAVYTNVSIADKICTLLKAVNGNHLSYCKREVYHLLI